MNTLYLRIPPRHTASWPNSTVSFAISTMEGSVIREGRSKLSELGASISKANVVVLIAATDVTLLELTIPPMPEAKLKLALPNLVEDQLMSDSSECVLLLGAKPADGGNKRHVAVAQRSWLQQLSASLFAMGANQVKALPAQLCLPWKKDQCSAFFGDQPEDGGLTLRLDEENGIGMLLDTLKPEETLATIAMLAKPGAIGLQLPGKLVADFKTAIQADPAFADRFTVSESSWTNTVSVARTVGLNLMAGLNSAQTNRIQWQTWRWPLILAGLVMFINIAALNYDYWTLKREAQALRQGMIQTYRATFPKDTVVAYPLEQMRKNLDMAERGSGQASPDDFTLLLTQFGGAWESLGTDRLPKLVSIEYKDHALVLQVKGDMPQKELQPALDSRGLVLKKSNADVWQVRNAK